MNMPGGLGPYGKHSKISLNVLSPSENMVVILDMNGEVHWAKASRVSL